MTGVVVLAGLAAFVVLTYAVVVLGGGALTATPSDPHLGLSVLATALVALSFDAVHSRLDAAVARLWYDGRPSPYQSLCRLSRAFKERETAASLLASMAQTLADGIGVEWSQVWIVVGDRPVLAATWPPEADPDPAGGADPRTIETFGRRWLPVCHGEELLGVLVVQERHGVPLTPVEERLFGGLAGQAGPVLRSARLRTQLHLQLAELSRRVDELRASRQRLVDVQDDERRRLERDIHDGAQQHLVALAVNLRLAHTLAGRSPDRATATLLAQRDAAAETIATLEQLSRGIYPPALSESGLVGALQVAVANAAVPVRISARGITRYRADLEATAYFCCLEAVQNAVKHSGSTLVRIVLRADATTLTLLVADDGAGFDLATRTTGKGLANMRDRIESAGGDFTLRSTPGVGTRIRARLPIGADTGATTTRRAGCASA